MIWSIKCKYNLFFRLALSSASERTSGFHIKIWFPLFVSASPEAPSPFTSACMQIEMHYFYTLNHVYLTLKCLSAIHIKSLIYVPLATTQTVTALPRVIFTPLSVNTDLRLENAFQTITRESSTYYRNRLSEIITLRGCRNEIKMKKTLCSYFFRMILTANQWKTMQTCLFSSAMDEHCWA